jgi:hypothetical protein
MSSGRGSRTGWSGFSVRFNFILLPSFLLLIFPLSRRSARNSEFPPCSFPPLLSSGHIPTLSRRIEVHPRRSLRCESSTWQVQAILASQTELECVFPSSFATFLPSTTTLLTYLVLSFQRALILILSSQSGPSPSPIRLLSPPLPSLPPSTTSTRYGSPMLSALHQRRLAFT